MSLALAGSIGLQVYWIRKAIALSEAQFATSVNDALNEVARRLEQRELNVFFIQAAEELEIIDESHHHVGHAGARDGRGHFRLHIVSQEFAGLTPLQCHRLVYAALGELMQTDIHALAIEARAP